MPAWFKLHHELLRDKKLRMMASELQMQPALVRGLWVDLLCFAQELDEDGHLRIAEDIPLAWEVICEELGADSETCMTFLVCAAKYRLTETRDGCLAITAWEDRQAKPSDSPAAVAERMRRYRKTPAGKLRMWFDNNKGKLAEAVFERDGVACQMCGTTENLVLDHVVALSCGGTNDVENLQSLCASCNQKKRTEVDIPMKQQMERVTAKNDTPTMKRDREEEKRREEKRVCAGGRATDVGRSPTRAQKVKDHDVCPVCYPAHEVDVSYDDGKARCPMCEWEGAA